MAFSDGFIDEVRRSADIVRYIADHVGLKKAGTNSWKGLCPFHQEKTPSFNVNPERAIFHCFGCGVGGDVFKFAMMHERLSFPEAVETVARRFGVSIPQGRVEPGPDRKQKEELLDLLDEASQHFTRVLWSPAGTKAREYLLGRGFQKETLERIRAGAAPDSWTSLYDALRARFPPSALQAAGLVLEKDGRRYYDRFRNRAVFPILGETGRVVAFGARSLDGSEPKYLNSPESPVYHKGKVLYGLSWARDAIRREGRAVLMEGYLDVARALEAGIEEAVATCGTALTPAHARLLHRFTDAACSSFDGDEAGQRATRKAADLLLEEGLALKVVELPAGHDPDSYLKAEGAEAYRQRLAQAPDYVAWLIARAAAENDTALPAGKAAYLNAILPTLVRIESAVERAAWIPRVIEGGRLDVRAAREELRRALAARTSTVSEEALAAPPPAPRKAPRLLPAEKLLLARVLAGSDDTAEALFTLDEEDLAELASADALRAARALASAGRPVSAGTLEEADLPDETRRLLREIAFEDSPAAGQGAMECARELRRLSLRRRLDTIQQGLGAASGESLEKLLQEKSDVVRQMAAL